MHTNVQTGGHCPERLIHMGLQDSRKHSIKRDDVACNNERSASEWLLFYRCNLVPACLFSRLFVSSQCALQSLIGRRTLMKSIFSVQKIPPFLLPDCSGSS